MSFSIASLFRAFHFSTVSCFKIYLFSLRESITSSSKIVFQEKKNSLHCLILSVCITHFVTHYYDKQTLTAYMPHFCKNVWFFSSMDVLLNMERVLYTPLIFRHHIDCIIRIYSNVCFLFLSWTVFMIHVSL